MNTPNNKRRKQTRDKISKVFITLLQSKEISEISVTDICKLAKINRSTFYVNYLDIYDLADQIKEKLWYDLLELYPDEVKGKYHSYNFLRLFQHIKDNQLYYKTLFKLNFDFSKYYKNYYEAGALNYYDDNKYINYHLEFFKAGLNAIIKKWLDNGCLESPEEIEYILKSEYKNKNNINN